MGIREQYPDSGNAGRYSTTTAPLKASWANDRHYFKRITISALALLKMVACARFGVTIVVMGLMRGKNDANSIIEMYAFALHVEVLEKKSKPSRSTNDTLFLPINPIDNYDNNHKKNICSLAAPINSQHNRTLTQHEDTKTRVNAHTDAYEYMVDYYQTNEQVITRPKLMAFERLKTGVHCEQKARPSLSCLFWIPLFHIAAEKLEQVETSAPQALLKRRLEELHVDKITRDGAKITTEQVPGLMAQSNRSWKELSLPEPMVEA
ncbi:hypothetical protein V6N11_056306 [Hibiscus sabdariffa]|uniref:Uncharacterized protein n=1 Tax=Hibiscus sabdariffa TaxID=183260 RepID=A0ABR2T3D4_9ROSI